MKTYNIILSAVHNARLEKPAGFPFFQDARYVAVIVALCRHLDSK